MSDSIKNLLAQYEPEPPQLDWKAIWIEQGRSEAQVELNSTRDRQLRNWKRLSLASMTLAAALLLSVALPWSAFNRPSTLAIEGSSPSDTLDSADITPNSPSVNPSPLLDQGTSVASLESDAPFEPSPDSISPSWLASWHPVKLSSNVENRQRLLAQGLTGLEAYDSTSRRPAVTAPPSIQKKNLTYKDLLERYFILPQTPTDDVIRQGDWL
jgi:hypothetical protein